MTLQSWTKRLIKRINGDPETIHARKVSCPRTGLVLYIKYATQEKVVRSYGICPHCEQAVHISELHKAPKTTYPIAFEGIWCKQCWDNPLAEINDSEDYTF